MSLYPDGKDPRRRDRLATGSVRRLRAATRAVHLAGSVMRSDCHRLDGASSHCRPIRRRLLSVRHPAAQSSTNPREDFVVSLVSVGKENVTEIVFDEEHVTVKELRTWKRMTSSVDEPAERLRRVACVCASLL